MVHYRNLSLEDIEYIDDYGVMRIEQWVDIPEYIGFYQVSDLARVKSLKRTIVRSDGREQKFKSRILRSAIMNSGYLYVGLSNTKKITGYTVHQLVAMAFLKHIPCRYKITVDHKDDNKLDSRLCNLHILTHRGNISKSKINILSKTCIVKCGTNFRVSFVFNGGSESLGVFNTLESANKAYLEAVRLIDLGECFNHIKRKKVSKTGVKGVYFDKDKYRVIFYKGGKNTSVGAYKTLPEAIEAYNKYKELSYDGN